MIPEFYNGFASEMEKIGVDWSILAPALAGAGLGGLAGYGAARGLGGGKKTRAAGAILGALGGAGLGAGGSLALQPAKVGKGLALLSTAPGVATLGAGKAGVAAVKAPTKYLTEVGGGFGEQWGKMAPIPGGARSKFKAIVEAPMGASSVSRFPKMLQAVPEIASKPAAITQSIGDFVPQGFPGT